MTSTMTREEAITRAAGNSLVGHDRLAVLWDEASKCAPLADGMVEVGVYKGGTATLLREAQPDATFVCFDTFEGHPEPSLADDPAHPAGRFNDTSIERVSSLFDGHPNPPLFVKGRFPDALDLVVLPERLSFVHVDVDLYEGTLAAFERLWPLLVPGGVMICDDYGFGDCPGAKRAVKEFVAKTSDAQLEEPATLQAIVRKART